MVTAAACMAADELPKAEEIIERALEVMGGRAAMERIRNQAISGTIEFTGKDLRGELLLYKALPNLLYSRVNLPGVGVIEEGVDGKVAWQKNLQGARIKEGQERAQALLSADVHAELNWRERYSKVEVAGVETSGDQTLYKVVLTPKEGPVQTRYYDQKTGLPAKVVMVMQTPAGEVSVEVAMSDFRDAAGVLAPHTLTQKAMGQEFVIRITSVKVNTEIDPARFALPDEVKALVVKQP